MIYKSPFEEIFLYICIYICVVDGILYIWGIYLQIFYTHMHYSESDTRSKFIDPQLFHAGWEEKHIIRERYFTDGRKIWWGKRGKQCYADYLLKNSGMNLAIVEAKKYGLPPTDGLEQVKEYGKKLDIRWVYSTNGKKIYEFDLEQGTGDYVDTFPSPQDLYQRYIDPNATLKQHLLWTPYRLEWPIKPRYYQNIAVTKILTALAEWSDRLLLTLATGTGKTRIAYWISQRLFDAKWTKDGSNRRPRILFLADRNVLVDQAMNTFNSMENDVLKITWKEIKKRHGKVPTNANIFFAIYQAIIAWSDEDTEQRWVSQEAVVDGYFRKYPSDFFDLIVIDECHRWWANEAGTRHAILQHFSDAAQLWLTATPKRDDNIDTYDYFGDPLYIYSLKEWINDGFLTPYKVKRIQTNIDELVLTSDDEVVSGEKKKDTYAVTEFNKSIIVPEYNDLIAEEILKQMWPHDKTIVFCVDQQHAANIRDAINRHKQVKHADYCVRVTSNDGDIWRNFLEQFQDNDKTIPTILTSSQMLTTWVDAKNVRNIVLLRNIGSMVEFKQIVWRGTRVYDGKEFFTIMDFTGATLKFYDAERDGEPEAPEPIADEADTDNTKKPLVDDDTGPDEVPIYKERLEVKLSNDRRLKIMNVETRYIDDSGRPMSATAFLEYLVGKLPALYTDEAQLRSLRANPDTRAELLTKLASLGINDDQLHTLQDMFGAQDSDIYDILAYLSFSSKMKTRHERVQRVREQEFLVDISTNVDAQKFLEFVLEYYEDHGSQELLRSKIGDIIDLYGHGTTPEIMKIFWWGENLIKMWYGMQEELYKI